MVVVAVVIVIALIALVALVAVMVGVVAEVILTPSDEKVGHNHHSIHGHSRRHVQPGRLLQLDIWTF